jgi:hypothetical protein
MFKETIHKLTNEKAQLLKSLDYAKTDRTAASNSGLNPTKQALVNAESKKESSITKAQH